MTEDNTRLPNKSSIQVFDISILYVEDDAFIRKMLVNILSNNIREIHTAENGIEGLELYNRLNPDIVLTDIRMPVMDGLEMSSKIKALNKDAHIIVTTAYGDTDNLLRSIEIGIDSYVLKPIDKNKLLTVLKRYADEISLNRKLKDQEEVAATTQALLMAAIEQSPSGILVSDAPTGSIRIANAAALSIRGETLVSLTNIPMTEQPKNWNFFKPDGSLYNYFELPHSMAIINGTTIRDVEMIIKRDNGEVRWVIANAAPVMDSKNNIAASILLLQDITERKKLSDQLHQAQKMEAVGQLTGGIAHDFNNILTAIIGYGSLVKNNLSEGDQNRSYVDQILSSAEKASALTRSLLAFSRKQIISPKQTDLNHILSGMEKLLSRLIGEDVELILDTSSDALNVFVDPGQIEQVIMNLATNARDAMPEGGMLKVSTSKSCLCEEGFKEKNNNKYALLIISDTGIGMSSKTLEKIFEPFFTTKEKGKGTGLGLAMVYGIIKQHNGYIFVSSSPGKGTEFRIYLPLVKGDFSVEDNTNSDYSSAPPTGTETLLLAEDSPEVREITKEILSNHGYSVIEAVDGEDAVAKFIQNSDKIQLLIFDVIMPRKNGKEAFEEIRSIKKDIKVIFVSGYATDILNKRNMLNGEINFLSKPVNPILLLRKIRELLDEKPKGI